MLCTASTTHKSSTCRDHALKLEVGEHVTVTSVFVFRAYILHKVGVMAPGPYGAAPMVRPLIFIVISLVDPGMLGSLTIYIQQGSGGFSRKSGGTSAKSAESSLCSK